MRSTPTLRPGGKPRTRLHYPPDRVGAPSGLHRRPSRAPTPLDYRQRGWTATLPQHPYRPRRKLRTLARAVVLHRKPGKGPDQDCRCPHRFSLAVSGCGYLVQAPSPLHLARPGLAKGAGLLLEGRPARPFFGPSLACAVRAGMNKNPVVPSVTPFSGDRTQRPHGRVQPRPTTAGGRKRQLHGS